MHRLAGGIRRSGWQRFAMAVALMWTALALFATGTAHAQSGIVVNTFSDDQKSNDNACTLRVTDDA